MMHVLRFLINLFFPPHSDVVHARTVSEQALVEVFSISPTARPSIYTGLPYHNPNVRFLIRANKFHADAHSARLLGIILFEMLTSIQEEHALETHWNNPLLIPIPSSAQKRRLRGHNQVEKIIQTLSQETLSGVTYAPHILKRHERKSQTHVPKEVRKQNIHHAFYVPSKQAHFLQGKSVLLIDDVSESGATMADAMRALKEAGVQKCIGIALAK